MACTSASKAPPASRLRLLTVLGPPRRPPAVRVLVRQAREQPVQLGLGGVAPECLGDVGSRCGESGVEDGRRGQRGGGVVVRAHDALPGRLEPGPGLSIRAAGFAWWPLGKAPIASVSEDGGNIAWCFTTLT